MKQRGAVLGAIATALNVGGSALVDAYDAVASLKTGGVPRGEQGRLDARLKECERKLERVYVEIGKEVALGEPGAPASAARDAGIELAADYRAEIAAITQRLRAIEDARKAAKAAAGARARESVERAAGSRMSAGSGAPEATVASCARAARETAGVLDVPEGAGAPTGREASGAPDAGESAAGVVTDDTN